MSAAGLLLLGALASHHASSRAADTHDLDAMSAAPLVVTFTIRWPMSVLAQQMLFFGWLEPRLGHDPDSRSPRDTDLCERVVPPGRTSGGRGEVGWPPAGALTAAPSDDFRASAESLRGMPCLRQEKGAP